MKTVLKCILSAIVILMAASCSKGRLSPMESQFWHLSSCQSINGKSLYFNYGENDPQTGYELVTRYYRGDKEYTVKYAFPSYVYIYSSNSVIAKCILNEKRLVSEILLKENPEETYKYEYDESGRLLRRLCLSETEEIRCDYIYDGKYNLAGWNSMYSSQKSENVTYMCKLSYSTMRATTSPLQMLGRLDVVEGFRWFEWPLAEAGLMGNFIPKYLIQEMKFLYNDGTELDNVSFSYHFNSNNYVTSMETIWSDGDSSNPKIFKDEFYFYDYATIPHSYSQWLLFDPKSPYNAR